MKKKKILTVIAVSALFSSLASCTRNVTSDSSSQEQTGLISETPSGEKQYFIETDIKAVYSIGEVIDFSNSYLVIKQGDLELERVSFLDSSFEIDGVDTSSEGNKTITIKYLGYTSTINYKVETHYVTFHLNGGTLNDSQEDIVASLNNNYMNIASYRPTKVDDEGNKLVFSGWFYDADLTNRASYQLDTDFYSESSVDLYAKFGVDHSSTFNYSIDEKKHTCSIVSLNFDNLFDLMSLQELVIPKEIDGYSVTEIGPNIFVDPDLDDLFNDFSGYFSLLTKITFEEGSLVEKIGDNAFKSLSGVVELNLPSSLKEIGDYALSNLGIQEIVIPKNVEKIGKGAISFNQYLSTVSFEEGSNLKIIDEKAFEMCGRISHMEFPSSLEEIRTGAFASCDDIETLTLPANVSIVSPGSFKLMKGLKFISVDENNKFYVSIDGNLYDKKKTKLLRYCPANPQATFTVPSSVKTIGDNAFDLFSGYTSLGKLVLPDSITYIGKEAFSGCSFDFTLPKSLSSFALGAFSGYLGSEIKVDSENSKYASKDGILYSKDFAKLFACPQNVSIHDYVLDDRVKTVCEYAFNKVNTLYSFTVSENSQIQEFRKDSLILTSCQKLNYFDFQPDVIPTFSLSSFYDDTVASNSNVFLLFKNENVKNAFLNVLPNASLSSDGISYSYNFEMFTYSELVDAIKGEMKKSGYTDFDYYKKEQHLYLFPNKFDYFKSKGLMYKISAVYSKQLADDTALGYFSLFEKYLYSSFVTQVVDQNSVSEINIRTYNILKNRYKNMPSSVKENIKSYMDQIAVFFAFSEDSDALTSLYREILQFDLDANTFDKAKYDVLRGKFDAIHFESRTIPSSVSTKLLYLDISNEIYQILNYKEYTIENVIKIYEMLHFSEDGSYYGLVGLIDSYINTDYRKTRIYKYNEFQAFLTRFEAEEDGILRQTVKEMEKKLKDFQFDKNDSAGASDFFNSIASYLGNYFMSQLQEDSTDDGFDYIEKYYILVYEIDIQVLLKNQEYKVSKENLLNYLDLDNIIFTTNKYLYLYIENKKMLNDPLNYVMDDSYQLDDETKSKIVDYDAYMTSKASWNTLIDSCVAEFNQALDDFELTDVNLTSESFDKLYSKLSIFGDYLSDYIDSDHAMKFNVIYTSYLVHQLIAAFPAEINETTLIEFKRFYYGYYDFDTGKTIEGISEELDSMISFIQFNGDLDDIKDYDKYVELLAYLA